MKSKNQLRLLASSLVFCASSHAADITWVGTTTGNWTTTTNWSSAAAPEAGNAYIVDGSGKTITNTDAASNTFAGDSLTVKNGAILRLFRTNGGGAITSTQTIPNLTIDGGTIRFASSAGSLNFRLANQVTFANAVTVETNDTGGFTNTLSFDNGFAGTGTLALQRSGTTGTVRTLTIAGTNSTSGYSGNVTASGNASADTLDLNINTASGWGTGSLTANAWSKVTLQTSVSSATSALAVNTNAVFSLGTTTFTGASLNQGGGIINLSVGGPVSGLLDISGTANLTGGSIAVTLQGDPTGKTYDILKYGGSLTGTPNFTLNGDSGRLTATFNNGSLTTDKVTLSFTGSVGNLVWTGATSDVWDNNTTQNFTNGGSPDVFRSFDNVLFDDSTTFNSPVLTGTLSCGALTFAGASDYTLSGAGNLAGGATITKTGSHTLTISNTTANTYTGNVTITGGTLKAGSATALGAAVVGSGTLVSSGATLDINGQNLGAELVTIAGTGVGSTGAIVSSGAQQTQALRFVTLSDDASIGGTGRWDIRGNTTATLNLAGHKLTKTGANYIAIVATNVTSGDIDVNAGTLGFSTTTTVNGTGTVKVNSGGNLEIAYGTVAANITRDIVLNGGTLSSVSTASAANSNISLTASSFVSSGTLTLNGNVSEIGGSYGITIPSGTISFAGATSFTGGLSVGPNVTATTTVTLSSLTTSAGKEIRIGNNITSGTTVQTLNVNGTNANSGTLYIGRQGVLNVNSGASWTQSAGMSVNGFGGYSSTMNVRDGASFTSTGTNPILLNGAAGNSGQANLNIAGTFTTSSEFEQTTAPSTGYGRVTLSGKLELGANVPQLTTGVQFYLSGSAGTIDTKAFNTTLGANITGAAAGATLTKLGTGKLTLTGANTYTGDTWLDAGTIAGNGTPSSKINAEAGTTIAPGASIGSFACAGADLTLGGTLAIEIDSSTNTADKLVSTAAVDITGASVSFTEIGSGTIPAGTKLVILDYTGTTLAGTFNGLAEGAAVNVGANSFTLSYVDTDRITLTSTTAATPYSTWAASKGLDGSAGKAEEFGDDPDGDGYDNGLEWILGGDPLSGADAPLVQATASATGGLTLTFNREEDSIGQATLTVEMDTDLEGTWTTFATVGATSAGSVTINTAPDPDAVSVNIPASNAVNGKLFGRLRATQP